MYRPMELDPGTLYALLLAAETGLGIRARVHHECSLP